MIRRLILLICLVSVGLLKFVLPASAQEAGVSFAILTGSGTVAVNSSFNVTVQVQSNGQNVDGAEIHLNFDPALLQVDSMAPGPILPIQIVPASFDNASGQIDYVAGTFSNFPNNSFDLLTITFKAKAAGTTPLQLPVSEIPRRSELTFAGTSLINIAAPIELSHITINESLPPTETPAPVGPTLSVQTEPSSGNLGQVMDVHLELAQVHDLYGLEVDCTVNPSVLIGTEHLDGSIFKSDNSFFVDRGFQLDGHWTIAATRLKPAPVFAGNGTAFNLRYLVAGSGKSDISCQATAVNADGFSIPMMVVNGTFSEEPVQPGEASPTPLPVPSATVPPTQNPTLQPTQPSEPQPSTLRGTVRLQGGTNFSGIALTLLSGGSTSTVLGQTQTNSDGIFQFGTLAAGDYVLQISREGYMSLIKTFSVVAESGYSLEVTLRAGDTNGDCHIDLADAALIGANFNMTVPPSPTMADLDRNGVINISDLALVGGNFGLVGPLTE